MEKKGKKIKLLTLRDFQEHPSNCSNSLLLDLHKIERGVYQPKEEQRQKQATTRNNNEEPMNNNKLETYLKWVVHIVVQ
jgi:hypothetical protein